MERYKIGDKVLCKKNFGGDFSGEIIFKEGEWYYIGDIGDIDGFVVYVSYYNYKNNIFDPNAQIENRNIYPFYCDYRYTFLDNFEEYFYIRVEMRKLKLEAIDGKVS